MKSSHTVFRASCIFFSLFTVIIFLTACDFFLLEGSDNSESMGGSIDSVSIKEGTSATGADPDEAMEIHYGESLSFNAVVSVTDSPNVGIFGATLGGPNEGIFWTSSNSTVATVSPSGTDNKQVTVTIVGSSGTATIIAASLADNNKTDSFTITAKKKSISSVSMTYTALTIDKGAATGNTAVAALGNFLVGSDKLADAVTFSIARKSGTSGTGPVTGTNITIDPETGTITIDPAQTAFTATTYSVIISGKGHYSNSKKADITLTVNAGTSVDSVNSVTIKEGTTSAGADPGETMTKAYGESLSFNAVVDVSGSPDEEIFWSTSDDTVATVSPSGTDKKQVSVTIVGSSGFAAIVAVSRADTNKTDFFTITAEKKSISSAAMTYTALTIDEGDASGNTVDPVIDQLLVGSDELKDAVTFSIDRKSGTGPEPGTNVTIDPETGTITIAPAQTAFTATTYTVTMTGKGHYKDSKDTDITLTVNAGTSGGSVNSVTIKEGSASTGADPGLSMTKIYGESLSFNAVVDVTDSPNEGIVWTTSDDTIATVNPSGTDNKQVSVTIVGSSGTATITAASQADATKTDSFDITAEKKSISTTTMTYTALAIDEGADTGNTADPAIGPFLVGNDNLADAVDFSIVRSTGAGPEPGTNITIDPATGRITIDPAQTAFTSTIYTVTMTGKNDYKDNKTEGISLTVNAGASGDSVNSVTIKEGSVPTGADPGAAMTKAYGESLSFNAVVDVTGSPDEGILWTTSDDTVATVNPSGTDNKQVSVTIVGSSGSTVIAALSQADNNKIDFFTITAEKKSISTTTMTYTALAIDEGADTGNTADPAIGPFLVGNDNLADAVEFSIVRNTGAGPEPGTNITIDSATGRITIAPAQTAFTSTIYTVTMTGKNNYKDSKTEGISLTVNAGASGDSVNSVTIKEGSVPTGADPGAAMTKAYGESLSFNAVVDVTGSPDEGILWTTSDDTVATVNPSGTDNKQVSVIIVGSSGSTVIAALSQADNNKIDFFTITAEKKSISTTAMTYTALTIDEGAATGNTAAVSLGTFLVGSDNLADAVTFSIARKSGTGPEPGTDISIDPATGTITIAPAQTAFTATAYTVTMTGKGDYKDNKTADITLTVNANPAIDSVSIREGLHETGGDPGASMTEAYGESLSFNAVVAVTGSPDEGIVWTTSDDTIATVNPSGTDNKQVSVTIVNSSGTATITATSQTDNSKTDSITITAERKSISSAAMTYTALTIDEGDASGNTVDPVIDQLLVGNDILADAVEFSIDRKSGTSGTGPNTGTNISIDPATGTITIDPAQTAFTATTYTVTMTGRGDYKDSKTADISLTVNVPPSVDSVTIKEGSAPTGADPGLSMTKIYGESLSFNAVVGVTGSPNEGIVWTTSDDTIATVSPSGTDNKQVSVTIVGSSGTATITATSQADATKTDSFDITAEKKSISSVSMFYSSLTIDEGATTGNTAAVSLGTFLVGSDNLADAVTFSIVRNLGTGPEPGTHITIDPATGTITIDPAQTAFNASIYNVTMTGKGHYKDSKMGSISLGVNAASTAAYGIPESITASTNTGTHLALSWDEFDSDTDTIYTVYAYNLTIRTSGERHQPLRNF